MERIDLGARVSGMLEFIDGIRTVLGQVEQLEGPLGRIYELVETTHSQELAVHRELAQKNPPEELEKLAGDVVFAHARRHLLETEIEGRLSLLESYVQDCERACRHLLECIQEELAGAEQGLGRTKQTLTDLAASAVFQRATARGLGAGEGSYEDTMPFEVAMEITAEFEEKASRGFQGKCLGIRVGDVNEVLFSDGDKPSVLGVFVATDEDFELGCIMRVICALPDDRTVEADAVVVWRRKALKDLPAGVGLEFLAIAEEDRRALDRLRGSQ